MKQILWLTLLVAVLSLTGLLPFKTNDVASLVPVETLTVDQKDGRVILKGKDCQGIGVDWQSALADLRRSGTGTVFLGTTEHVVLSRRAASLLPEIVRDRDLRPAAVICVCPGEPPNPEKAAKYLSAHEAGVRIQEVQAIMLRAESVKLPMLVETEGGLRLYGAENG